MRTQEEVEKKLNRLLGIVEEVDDETITVRANQMMFISSKIKILEWVLE